MAGALSCPASKYAGEREGKNVKRSILIFILVVFTGYGIASWEADTPPAKATVSHAQLHCRYGVAHANGLPAQCSAPEYRTHTCEWNNSQARVLCVHRAPQYVCRAVFNSALPCWWFTGSDTQIVFNWKGLVATS